MLIYILQRYIILAAEPMKNNEKDNKKMATACFETIGLEADKWRVGHTKARDISLWNYIDIHRIMNIKQLLE